MSGVTLNNQNAFALLIVLFITIIWNLIDLRFRTNKLTLVNIIVLLGLALSSESDLWVKILLVGTVFLHLKQTKDYKKIALTRILTIIYLVIVFINLFQISLIDIRVIFIAVLVFCYFAFLFCEPKKKKPKQKQDHDDHDSV